MNQTFLTWWCFTWRWAHRSRLRAWADVGLSEALAESLAVTRHQHWLTLLGIDASQPITPCPALLQWLALVPSQQQEALRLVGRISFPMHNAAVAGEHEDWSRSLAKALRPGVWIPPGVVPDARVLLAAWVAPPCWPRLALSWPHAEIEALNLIPGPWPHRKLDTLWQAVLWRVHSIPQPDSEAH